MKKELSYKQVRLLDATIANYLIVNGHFVVGEPATETKPGTAGSFIEKSMTKLAINMKNIKKQCEKHFEKYQELKADLQLDNCAVDEKTKVILPLHPNGSRQYTVEGEKKLNAAIKILEATEVDIHVRITEGEWNLTQEEKELFNGILIPEFESEKSD